MQLTKLGRYQKFHKGHAELNAKGMTLMELTISIGIASILAVVVIAFTSNTLIQHNKQKEAVDNHSKVLYLSQLFNRLDRWPEVRVRGDGKAVKLTDSINSPAREAIYYEFEGALYKDEYEDTELKSTTLLASGFTLDFQYETDISYSKDLLGVQITDRYGQTWTRKISLRDCETVETY